MKQAYRCANNDTISLAFLIKYGHRAWEETVFGVSAAYLLIFNLSLTRETWAQELFQVVKVIVGLPS